MKLKVKNLNNQDVSELALNPDIFDKETREDILYRVVHWQLAKARSGTHKTKGRSEVSGSTKKIYKQKGTGQARHGAITAPIFVGGGIVFGPQVRPHGYSLNKKVRNLGLKIALSLKLRENSVILLDSAEMKSPSTKDLTEKLNNFSAKSALIVDSNIDSNLKVSSSNIHGCDVIPSIGLNVYDILNHEKIFITLSAIKDLDARLM
jgi:large subunit ribosomal protein L4